MPDLLKRLRARPARLLLAASLLSVAAAFAAEGAYRLFLRSRAAAGARHGVFELYAVGDSSMRGLPFYISSPEIVSLLLGDKLGGRELAVNNLAEGGSSIYTQALKAARTLKYRDRSNPAAVLIYAGHAENITAHKSRASLLPRAYEKFKTRVLSHSLLFSKLFFDIEKALLFYGVRDLGHYEFYLRRTIEAALDAGAVPIIATLGSNLEVEPSVGDRYLPSAEEVLKAFGAEERGETAKALAEYTRLYAGAAPEEAGVLRPYLAYRIGRCLQSAGKPEAALARFAEALENDPYPLRSKPSQNAIVRRLAGEYSIQLVDAEALFMENSPGKVPGEELFVDTMHPGPAGTLLLSRAFAQRLAELLHDRVRNDLRDPLAIYESPRRDITFREGPYVAAGVCLLWSGQGNLPIPDCLKLADKNFRKALSMSPGDRLARIGLRVTAVSKKNRYIIPWDVYKWYNTKRRYYELRRQFTDEEMAEADKFLAKWEKP